MNVVEAEPHITSLVLIELGLMLLALAGAARLAQRARLSPVPLYLLAGLAAGGVLPLVGTEFAEVAAEIGVVLLLFMLGLEYTSEELASSLRSGTAAGGVDLIANFVPGALAGLILGWGAAGAVLLGGVTYISSSGVVAKLLADLDRIGNRETPAVLSILVIEDLVMAVYLPLVAVLLLGDGGLGTLGIAVLAVVAALWLALRFGHPLTRALASHSTEALLLSVLGLVLLVAGLAQRLQVSSAVGAFLVGIALTGEVADRSRDLLTPLRDLFAAIFFVFFAAQIDPSSLPRVAAPALALALATALTKMATGWWAARRIGVRVAGRVRAGAALVARGEFSIVIAGLGATVEPRLGPLAAAYVLLLAIAGPLLARAADPLGRRLAQRLEPT